MFNGNGNIMDIGRDGAVLMIEICILPEFLDKIYIYRFLQHRVIPCPFLVVCHTCDTACNVVLKRHNLKLFLNDKLKKILISKEGWLRHDREMRERSLIERSV